MTTELILRDTLAIDRTRLANQRTLLAFVRTGLYLCFTGIGIFHINKDDTLDWLAWTAIGIGIFIAIIGLINYLKMAKKIAGKYQRSVRDSARTR